MADSADGLPYASRSDTPDQQGAGVVNPPTMSPASLLAMLSGMGAGAAPPPPPGMPPPPPPGLGGTGMGSLLGMLPPPVSQTSVFAQALSGGISAMRGTPDPVQAIVQNQQRQQLGIMDIIQKMDAQKELNLYRQDQLAQGRARLLEARNEHAEKRLDGQMQMLRQIMDSPNASPAGMAYAQEQFGKLAQQRFGVAPPPSIVQRVMNTEQQKSFAMDVWRMMPQDEQGHVTFDPSRAPQLLKAHPLGTLQDVQGYVEILNKPGALESYGLPTRDTLRKHAADTTLKEGQALESLMPPGFQRTAANAATMSAMAQELYPDVPILKLTRAQQRAITDRVALRAKETKADALESRMEQQLQNGLAMIQARGDTQMANALAMAEWKAKNPTGKPPDWKQISRDLEPFVGLSGGAQKLQFLRRTIAAMPEAAFPADSAWGRSFAGRWAAKQYREKVLGGDQDVVTLQAEIMNIMNGVVGRKWLDDKGTRVWASQQMEYQTIDSLPPRKAIDGLLKTIQDEMVTDLKNRLSTLESSGVAPEPLLKAARAAIGRVDPTAKAAQPATPLAPLTIQKTGKFMDMRKGSATYGKTIEATYNVGDPIPDGYVEVK